MGNQFQENRKGVIMANMNHVTLIGRLTRDAEMKYTNSGMAVARFSLAVNSRRKNGDQWEDKANFFDCTVFGKTAENLTQYLTKGKEIAVEGSLNQSRWEQDGQSRSRIEVIAQNIQLLGGKSESAPSTGSIERYQPPEDNGFEDDIPF